MIYSHLHGLCGRFRVLACEDQAEYDDLLLRFMEAEKPADDVERELVAKMARSTWMSERALRFQEGCFSHSAANSRAKAANRGGFAVRKDLDNYVRYQTTHDRAYDRAAAALAKHRPKMGKAAIGIVSQERQQAREQRAEAAETRRATAEIRKVEGHQIDMQIKKRASTAQKHMPWSPDSMPRTK